MLDNIEYMRNSLWKLEAIRHSIFDTEECANSERCASCAFRTFCSYLFNTVQEAQFALQELKNTTI